VTYRTYIARVELQLWLPREGNLGKGEELKYNWKAGKGDEARVEEDRERERARETQRDGLRSEGGCF
jgi:hypothetical protein